MPRFGPKKTNNLRLRHLGLDVFPSRAPAIATRVVPICPIAWREISNGHTSSGCHTRTLSDTQNHTHSMTAHTGTYNRHVPISIYFRHTRIRYTPWFQCDHSNIDNLWSRPEALGMPRCYKTDLIPFCTPFMAQVPNCPLKLQFLPALGLRFPAGGRTERFQRSSGMGT